MREGLLLIWVFCVNRGKIRVIGRGFDDYLPCRCAVGLDGEALGSG
jgi:hypothetical protein